MITGALQGVMYRKRTSDDQSKLTDSLCSINGDIKISFFGECGKENINQEAGNIEKLYFGAEGSIDNFYKKLEDGEKYCLVLGLGQFKDVNQASEAFNTIFKMMKVGKLSNVKTFDLSQSDDNSSFKLDINVVLMSMLTSLYKVNICHGLPGIEKIILRNCNMTNEALPFLVQILEYTPNLEYLDISRNEINNSDCLVDAIKNSKLLTLDISCNDLTKAKVDFLKSNLESQKIDIICRAYNAKPEMQLFLEWYTQPSSKHWF